MAAPPVRIKVGASLDASVDRVFGSVENRAKRAQKVVQSAFKGGFGAKVAAEDAATAWGRAGDNMGRTTRKIRDDSFRYFAEIGRVAERELNRAARATFNAQQRAGRQFAERTSHRATRFLMPNAPLGSYAARAAGDIARGIGVDLNVGSSIQRNVSLSDAAIGLAQQERIATGGRSAGAQHYEDIARKTGSALGTDPTEVVALMRAFTGKTGEFGKLEDIVNRLAPAAIASGTGFADMGNAAGFFYNQVKHLPNALELTEEGMRAIIGQTAVGSVEMPDFAKQMGRIAAGAPKFAGAREHTIAQSSALAQLAIESGGATSAADAGRAVQSFQNTFGKSARMAAFKRHGVDLYTDKSQTTLRDQFDIIRDSIRQTKGNVPALADMFADTLGRKPVTALVSKYTDAGGGEAGMRAVDAALEKYMKTTMTADTQQKNVSDHLNSTSGKVATFQGALDSITKKTQDNILPKLERLEPALVNLADALGNITGFILENPWKALAGAVALAIGRAGIESALRAGIERLILGTHGGFGTQAAGVGKVAGSLGATMTVASMVVTSAVIAQAAIDNWFAKSQEKQKKDVENDISAQNLENQIRSGKFTPEEAARKTKELAEKRQSNVDSAREDATGIGREIGDFLVGNLVGFFSQDAKDAVAARRKGEEQQLVKMAKASEEALILQRNLHNLIASGITVKNLPTDENGRHSQK